MKIRAQHVSNSSTCSFLVIGYDKRLCNFDEFEKFVEENKEMNGEKYYSMPKWLEDINKARVVIAPHYEHQSFNGYDQYADENPDDEKYTLDELPSKFGAGIVLLQDTGSVEDVPSEKEVRGKLREFGISIESDARLKIYVWQAGGN